VVALVLFGPETLKSLSKDVGKAAAELKEIPKTFKEGTSYPFAKYSIIKYEFNINMVCIIYFESHSHLM